jgi:hypothetical protein
MGEEIGEDTTRGDTLMEGDSDSDEARAEAYMVMSEGLDQ